MFEQVILAEQFQNLLAQAQRAEQMYADLANHLTDRAMRQEVEQLRRDKRRHILLTERLVELVE